MQNNELTGEDVKGHIFTPLVQALVDKADISKITELLAQGENIDVKGFIPSARSS